VLVVTGWGPSIDGVVRMWGRSRGGYLYLKHGGIISTRNVLTFVNTTAIAYRQNSAF